MLYTSAILFCHIVCIDRGMKTAVEDQTICHGHFFDHIWNEVSIDITINWSNVSQFVDHCLYNYIRIRVKDLTLPYLCTVLFEADMISMWLLKTLTLLLNLFHSHIKIIYNVSAKTYKVTLRCEHLRKKNTWIPILII